MIYLSIFNIEVSLAQKQLEYVFKPSKYLWQFGYNGLVAKTSKQNQVWKARFILCIHDPDRLVWLSMMYAPFIDTIRNVFFISKHFCSCWFHLFHSGRVMHDTGTNRLIACVFHDMNYEIIYHYLLLLCSLMMCANNPSTSWPHRRIRLFSHHTTSVSSLCRPIWKYWFSKMLFTYILPRVCV